MHHRHHHHVASLAGSSQAGSEVKAIGGPLEPLPAPCQRLCVVSGRWDLAFSSPQRARWRLLSHRRWELAVILSGPQPFPPPPPPLPLVDSSPPHSVAKNHSVRSWREMATRQFWMLDFILFASRGKKRLFFFFKVLILKKRKKNSGTSDGPRVNSPQTVDPKSQPLFSQRRQLLTVKQD